MVLDLLEVFAVLEVLAVIEVLDLLEGLGLLKVLGLSDFPFLEEIKGGSLYISLSSGWFCIRCHFSVRMFFKHGSDG